MAIDRVDHVAAGTGVVLGLRSDDAAWHRHEGRDAAGSGAGGRYRCRLRHLRLRNIRGRHRRWLQAARRVHEDPEDDRSEEHTSELQSLMRISYAVFCLKKKKNT